MENFVLVIIEGVYSQLSPKVKIWYLIVRSRDVVRRPNSRDPREFTDNLHLGIETGYVSFRDVLPKFLRMEAGICAAAVAARRGMRDQDQRLASHRKEAVDMANVRRAEWPYSHAAKILQVIDDVLQNTIRKFKKDRETKVRNIQASNKLAREQAGTVLTKKEQALEDKTMKDDAHVPDFPIVFRKHKGQ